MELKDFIKFGECSKSNIQISNIKCNSSNINFGDMFVGLTGKTFDGSQFIPCAIENGATVILTYSPDHDPSIPSLDYYTCLKDGTFFIFAKNPRYLLSKIAANFYSNNLDLIAVITGTNGKTSTADFLRQIWSTKISVPTKRIPASIGTIGVFVDRCKLLRSSNLTCPEPITLNNILCDLEKSHNVTHVVLEASSHGLDQFRIDGLKISIAGFTNFSHDHLDYHGTLQNYWNAKKRLFSQLIDKKTVAVLNADDNKHFEIETICKTRGIKYLSYGLNGKDIKIIEHKFLNNSQLLKVNFCGKVTNIQLPIVGDFQVCNSMCAAGMAYTSGMQINDIVDALEKLSPVIGRMEKILDNIYVDYAHTPDGLQCAIESLRKHSDGKIIVVFGCGGDRDTSKRKTMGEIAQKYADIAIITDDNPRNENSQNIREMILKGCNNALEIPDRHEAIFHGMKIMKNNDILLVAGKGHENYQQIGDTYVKFSDKDVIIEMQKKL